MKETNSSKQHVYNYWNNASCGTEFIHEKKFTKEYFEAIENFRYTIEPEIFSFAQFTRYHGKKVLEVGVGAGSDFLQWVRAGAHPHGIDLTHEAIRNVQHRLNLYNLHTQNIQVADAEQLPYNDNTFDLTYSWGVIHHSPNMEQCLSEIIRVTKPGGEIKIMIYNRRSLFAFYQYLIFGLFKGKPFSSIKKILYTQQESPGTKAYTRKEIKNMLTQYPVTIIDIDTTVSNHDLLYYRGTFARFVAHTLTTLWGWKRAGWFMRLTLKKYD